MKITLNQAYKSIRAFDTIELPNFTVITGTNGAGKSQFLNGLEQGALSIEGVPHHPHHNRQIRLFDATTLIPADTGKFSSAQGKQEKEMYWNQLNSVMDSMRSSVESYGMQWPELASFDIKKLTRLTPEDLLQMGVESQRAHEMYAGIVDHLNAHSSNLTNQFNAQNPAVHSALISKLVASSRLPLIAFDVNTFYEHFPLTWQPVDLFQQSFARLFSEYQARFVDNEVNGYRRDVRGANVQVLTDHEFIAKYGVPPWDFLNEILEVANLSFRVNKPDESGDRPYEAVLTDLVTGAQVKFNDLSSGERILMSFALCLYYTKDNAGDINYPAVLLFDEIDAPLHPSMTKSLLDTIQKVLIKERGIKVVLTTHSPSTVALSPESAIFVMRKEGSSRLSPSSKDHALSLLMSGVPSISLSYVNRRQVFVESHLDVLYYDLLLEKLKPHMNPEVSLTFIASTESKVSGCEHVKDVVRQLRKAGNSTVKGLIDWDAKNSPDAGIVVLGHDKRHSIENYILDPLLVAMLLYQERVIGREDLGLLPSESGGDIPKLDDARLQHVVSYVAGRLASSAPDLDLTPIELFYLGGRSVTAPRFMLIMRGHDLEELYKSSFEPLRQYRRQGDLKKAILNRIVDDFPDLIPNCFLEAFLELQQDAKY